jgi:hypothetical protein
MFPSVRLFNLCFPRATRGLCAKHLKDNAIDNLRKSLPQPEVTEIVSQLFGPSGILSSEDQVTFDELRDELTETYDIPYLGPSISTVNEIKTYGKSRNSRPNAEALGRA